MLEVVQAVNCFLGRVHYTVQVPGGAEAHVGKQEQGGDPGEGSLVE